MLDVGDVLCVSYGVRFAGLHALPWILSRERLQTHNARFTEKKTVRSTVVPNVSRVADSIYVLVSFLIQRFVLIDLLDVVFVNISEYS